MSAMTALNDPASIYFQHGPMATRTATAAASVLPVSGLRSLLRRLYFGYLFYYPELRYGSCLVRYVQNSADQLPSFEAWPPATNTADTQGLDAEPARVRRSRSAANETAAVASYAAIAEQLQQMLHRFVCTDAGKGVERACAQAHQSALTAPTRTLHALDDATIRLYKTLALNVAERWMQTSPLVRPVLGGAGGARRMRDIADVMLDGLVRGMREQLVPGLYGCTQQYFVEMLWRVVEQWL